MATEFEFIDRAKAEAEAARAISLLNSSDEAKVEAWFALQAVADQVGAPSNVGVRGIHYATFAKQSPRYQLRIQCVKGTLNTYTGAPATLELAREPFHLDRAIALLERKAAELGGPVVANRPKGTGSALVAAVGSFPEGAEWLTKSRAPRVILLRMVQIADAYGRDGVYPFASFSTHYEFLRFDDRAKLVRRFPTTKEAQAKAMSLRTGDADAEGRNALTYARIEGSAVRRLSVATGTTRRESRVILQALMDGRSERALIRLVREAAAVASAMGKQEAHAA